MIGKTILHFKILDKLGEGGMGEVYKAQDTKLDRFVALKFLPPNLTADAEQKTRFIQEAKAASAMNHPNVCTIFDIQEDNGQLFIVMEYVDGKTLGDKKDSISEKQILEVGSQVAEGLAAAHEKGIVHRDIKPENIMVRKDGIAQIMDFGLAKLYDSGKVSRLTKAGTTLGTMGYMSPEQVQGLDVDHRTDIFSLGVVLYELLAGESPFKGMHETAIMYEIVNVDAPPITTLKPDIDGQLDNLILECLEKDKDERCQSAKELAKNLRKLKRSSSDKKNSRVYQSKSFSEDFVNLETTSGVFDVNFKNRLSQNKVSLSIIFLLAVSLLIMLSGIIGSSQTVSGSPIHLSLNVGDGIALGSFSSFAISPDGSEIVYAVNGPSKRMLFLRDLNSYQPRPIQGTEGGYSPFFSPDGKWLGFLTHKKTKKILLSTGTVIDVFNGVPTLPYFFWGTDNNLYFTPEISGGIYRISANGGKPMPVVTLGAPKGQINYRWPVLIPGSKAIIFTSETSNESGKSEVLVRSLETGKTKMLINNASYAQYIKSGYITFIRNNTLFASRFDPDKLTLIGASIPVIQNVTTIPQTGQAEFSISDNGTLVYLPGGPLSTSRDLVWVNQSGKILKATDLDKPIEDLSLSPDGKKVAVTVEGTTWGIWLYDIERNTLSRFTYNADDRDPLWTPDGKSIVYGSFRNGFYGLFISPVNGSRKEAMLTKSKNWEDPYSISSDGKYLAFAQLDSLRNVNIAIKEINGNSKPKIFIKSKFLDWVPVFSPNGKYLAYGSTESGQEEIYVIPFKGSGNKLQISIHGGSRPLWSPDGKSLYYFQEKRLMEVPVNTGTQFSAGKPKELFSGDFWQIAGHYFTTIPNSKNFLMIKQKGIKKSRDRVNVIINWKEELKDEIASAN